MAVHWSPLSRSRRVAWLFASLLGAACTGSAPTATGDKHQASEEEQEEEEDEASASGSAANVSPPAADGSVAADGATPPQDGSGMSQVDASLVEPSGCGPQQLALTTGWKLQS